MKTFLDYRLRLVIGLAIASTIGFGINAAENSLPQDTGQGASPGTQAQPQTPPQARPRPTKPAPGGKPSDGPQTQPVRPQPGKPSTGRPPGGSQPGRPQPGRPSPGKPSPGKPPSIQPVRPPRPTPGKPGYRPPPRPVPSRPPYVRPQPPYQWRPGDSDRLRRHYRRRFGYINRARRPTFIIGGYIPFGDRGYFSPVPADLLGYLPAVPPGYVIGYFDGYCVVYDPVTFTIINFIDLLN